LVIDGRFFHEPPKTHANCPEKSLKIKQKSTGDLTPLFIPELKGCVSQGDTLEEALNNIKEAMKLYLEDMDEEERQNPSSKNC